MRLSAIIIVVDALLLTGFGNANPSRLGADNSNVVMPLVGRRSFRHTTSRDGRFNAQYNEQYTSQQNNNGRVRGQSYYPQQFHLEPASSHPWQHQPLPPPGRQQSDKPRTTPHYQRINPDRKLGGSLLYAEKQDQKQVISEPSMEQQVDSDWETHPRPPEPGQTPPNGSRAYKVPPKGSRAYDTPPKGSRAHEAYEASVRDHNSGYRYGY
ncbi:hypothetical protein AMATHDRAFT_42124 [Amanita thiersii Skay4041]|uniref:Uncharacterized protein n=1 Tax=Amanita thiersii Skay4041 TaxID=703135 RepID=A0A2A9NCA5_9AGAR|nr:hypothetical protein AMATHDRAFT_42124 [Amanita thiersii Skay4041]